MAVKATQPAEPQSMTGAEIDQMLEMAHRSGDQGLIDQAERLRESLRHRQEMDSLDHWPPRYTLSRETNTDPRPGERIKVSNGHEQQGAQVVARDDYPIHRWLVECLGQRLLAYHPDDAWSLQRPERKRPETQPEAENAKGTKAPGQASEKAADSARAG